MIFISHIWKFSPHLLLSNFANRRSRTGLLYSLPFLKNMILCIMHWSSFPSVLEWIPPSNSKILLKPRMMLLYVYSCRSGGTVSCALPFMTNVTISTSISRTYFPFLGSNIQSSLAYGVFISQLIRYARTCSSYECLILRAVQLSC